MAPDSGNQMDCLKQESCDLEKISKTFTKQQKHIKAAGHLDFRWATVQAYDTDDLTPDLDNQIRLNKAEKEVERCVPKNVKLMVQYRSDAMSHLLINFL